MRESLFGALESLSAIEGARVLDLYAGSGALGLEALSRGAASAEFVERARQAAAIVRRNAAVVAKAGGLPPGRVHESTAHAFLQRATGPFDLVFTDPPYDLDDTAMTADLVALAPLLSADAVVVVEWGEGLAERLSASHLDIRLERADDDTRTAVWHWSRG